MTLAAGLSIGAPIAVAVVAASPEADALAGCLRERLATEDSVRLVEGLEFRVTATTKAGDPALVTMTSLIKPDLYALQSVHEDERETQPAAAAQF